MKFPDHVTVSLVVRKIDEETIGDDIWLTYVLEGAEGVQLTFQIEGGSFVQPDVKDLEAVLAEDLADAIVKTVRDAQARIDKVN